MKMCIRDRDYFSPVKGNMVKLNVDQLPAGEYEIELADDFRIQKQTFSKNTERIWMKDDIQTIFKPIIKTEGAIIKVNFLNLDHSSSIEILDPSNRIIYSSEINQKQYSKPVSYTHLDVYKRQIFCSGNQGSHIQ